MYGKFKQSLRKPMPYPLSHGGTYIAHRTVQHALFVPALKIHITYYKTCYTVKSTISAFNYYYYMF